LLAEEIRGVSKCDRRTDRTIPVESHEQWKPSVSAPEGNPGGGLRSSCYRTRDKRTRGRADRPWPRPPIPRPTLVV
jgi:hypothetical protein